MANANLGNAKIKKKDEFYTQYCDIQQEMNAYVEYNSDVFRDKTILFILRKSFFKKLVTHHPQRCK